MDLMTARRGIILSQPYQEVISGSLVHFAENMSAPLVILGSGNITIAGVNLFDEVYPDIAVGTIKYRPLYVGNSTVTLSTNAPYSTGASLFILPGNVSSGASSNNNGVWNTRPRTVTAINGYITIAYMIRNGGTDPRSYNALLEIGSEVTEYDIYKGTTAPIGASRKSLLGINNIWSDTGDITVKYWTH